MRFEVGFPANGRDGQRRGAGEDPLRLPAQVRGAGTLLSESGPGAAAGRGGPGGGPALHSGAAARAGAVRLRGQRQRPAPGVGGLLQTHERRRQIRVPQGAGGHPGPAPGPAGSPAWGSGEASPSSWAGATTGSPRCWGPWSWGSTTTIAGDGREYVITAPHGGEDPGGGRPEHPQNRHLSIHQRPSQRARTPRPLRRRTPAAAPPRPPTSSRASRRGPPCSSSTRTPAPPTSWSGTS